MTTRHGAQFLLAAVCMVFTLQANAIDWGDSDKSTKRLKEMVNRVQKRYNEINDNPNLQDTLNEARKQVKQTLKDNRPTGDFVSGCSGDCIVFRHDMLKFMSDIEFTMDTLRQLGEPVQQDGIEFKRTKKAIEKAPGPILFPLAVAFNESGVFNGLTTRFSNLADSLALVKEDFENRPSKCAQLLSDPIRSRKLISGLAANGAALTIVGKILLALGETNMMAKKKVGVHGYAGVIVEDNKKKKLGQLLDGIGATVTSVAAKTDRTFYQCEILDTLFVNNDEIRADIATHDEEVKEMLTEIIRLQLTPQGQRSSDFVGSFPLK